MKVLSLLLSMQHVDVDLYKYSGYGIGSDRKGSYSIGDAIGEM